MPETEQEARELREWAESQSDRPIPATVDQIGKHLDFLAATLPSRNSDEDSGKKRAAVYASILGDFSNDALAYMARRACAEFDWFPTPRQCLDILRDWKPPISEKERALTYCHQFWQDKFDGFIEALKSGAATQAYIDEKPERWKLIAMERGYLRLMDDGSFAIRQRLKLADAT